MKTSTPLLLPFVLSSFTVVARAQTGTLDQVSPFTGSGTIQGATFNGDASILTWQAQVSAGLTGQLEGFTLELTGPQGATLGTALRVGPGWNTSAILFQSTIVKPTSGTDDVFVNATSAGIQLTPGSLFVIEMQGQNTMAYLNGTYAPSGPPAYAEPLFLNGPGCYAGCGWRIGFRTWVLQGTGTPFCFGDGSGTACPCVNSGAAGHGCENSAGTGGAMLTVTGAASLSADTVQLTCSGELPTALSIVLQGTSAIAPVNFGDGLRCTGGFLKRLYVKSASGGVVIAPQPGDPSISARSAALGDPIPLGATRNYQVYYRDASPSFCPNPPGSTFNVSGAIAVAWGS